MKWILDFKTVSGDLGQLYFLLMEISGMIAKVTSVTLY